MYHHRSVTALPLPLSSLRVHHSSVCIPIKINIFLLSVLCRSVRSQEELLLATDYTRLNFVWDFKSTPRDFFLSESLLCRPNIHPTSLTIRCGNIWKVCFVDVCPFWLSEVKHALVHFTLVEFTSARLDSSSVNNAGLNLLPCLVVVFIVIVQPVCFFKLLLNTYLTFCALFFLFHWLSLGCLSVFTTCEPATKALLTLTTTTSPSIWLHCANSYTRVCVLPILTLISLTC